MKIKVKSTGYRVVDIGPLDMYWRWALKDPSPKMARLAEKWRCAACRKPFAEGETQILAIKTGYPNMRLHERCWDGTGRKRTESEEGR